MRQPQRHQQRALLGFLLNGFQQQQIFVVQAQKVGPAAVKNLASGAQAW